MPHTPTRPKGPASLSDLPGLVAQYGESQRLAATPASSTTGRTTRNVGTGVTGFNLVESDLTPNSPSDEREPSVSPNGDFIAFTSTGADANNDGKIDSLSNGGLKHIWIMNRDGTGQRQLTGLIGNVDVARNQSHPTWSPDGNQIAYSDEDTAANSPNLGGSQLFVVSSLDANPVPSQRTFFYTVDGVPATVTSPAWAPSGLSIAFVTNYDGRDSTTDSNGNAATPTDSARHLPTRDIFSVAPDGSSSSITRITGDPSTDSVGNTTDDDHPAWATVNTNILFFSSNRDANGLLTDNSVTPNINEANGRRIWRVFADGTAPNPITDPLQRTNGQADDRDDYPVASVVNNNSSEQLAFQTNTYLDNSDQADGPRGRDLNIWSLPISTNSYVTVEPRTYVGSFDDGKIVGVNSRTLQLSATVPRIPTDGTTIPNVEGVLVSPNGKFLFAADRTNKRVLRFNESDGSAAGSQLYKNSSAPLSDAQFTPSNIINPVGLKIRGNFLYVTSGTGAPQTNPTLSIYRFNLDTGDPAPSTINANAGDTTGLFSSGDTTGAGLITNGAEGIDITSDGQYIAVADVIDSKINLYDRQTGAFIVDTADNGTFVPAGSGGLNLATGITWGPDLNGDGHRDLYVCSSGNDSVKVYSGPDLTASDPFTAVGAAGVSASTRPGTFIGNLIAEPTNSDGAGPGSTGLNGPEFIRIADLATSGTGTFGADGTPEVYVSSFRTLGTAGNGVPGGGFQVNRYGLDVANAKANPWPAGDPSPSTTPVNAAWISIPPDSTVPGSGIKGAGAFDFNLTTLNQAVGTVVATTAEETSGQAVVLTNILSSPTNFTASRLTAPQTVDRSADREPAYSRTTATAQTISRLVFASGRKYTPSTTSNGSTTPSNPYGGDQFDSSGAENTGVTHDIWTASTRDTTPPALVPQGAGNLQYPVVAPQPNAPFVAPRTAEAGLKVGLVPTSTEKAEILNSATTNNNTYAKRGGLRFAVVLRDAESGLQETTSTVTSNAVTVRFFNADSPQFQVGTDVHNSENIDATNAKEKKAAIFSINGATSFALNVYDDGPVAGGGHEQEAGAVAGDGNYYCEGVLPTPATTGDFYIDVSTVDRVGNSLTYDNVWGISTRRFVRQSNGKSDLFVSDYTCGQNFPFTLGRDVRFDNQQPIESYYLNNPQGVAVVSGDASVTTTLPNVDVWRILCRGPVTQDVLNAYRPTISKQIDPTIPNPTPLPTSTPLPGATATPVPTAGPTATPTATPLPYSQLTRNVAVATSSVFWAAPYAGTTFVGPGTIIDPTTQASLTSFLSDGGRLFVSGRDVAWALSSAGTITNSFLTDELATNYGGEIDTLNQQNTITAAENGGFLGGGQQYPLTNGPRFDYYGDYVNLQFPTRIATDGNTFEDGAYTLDPFRNNTSPDVINPAAPTDATVTADYTYRGARVGQRILHINRNNGLQSRAVFFSFGMEAVNRRYRVATPGDGRVALSTRPALAEFIKRYFKTSGVSGTVINNATNLPVPNFLIRVVGGGGTFFARTDVNGNYSITGLPTGSYTTSAYLDTNGLTSPQGFFGGTPVGFGVVGGGPIATGINLRVIPAIAGAVIGKAVTSNGTFADRTDDTAIPNLAVLIRSVGESSIFPGGGKFARLTTTNATGDFTLANVPAQAEMQVIFNPSLDDIPAGSNISYSGPNANYGRRILPDAKRPLNLIIVPSGNNFILNDTGTVKINGTSYTVDASANPDTAADEKVPVLVPVGPTISGTVSVNSTPVAGATVQLFTVNSDNSTGAAVTNPVQTSGSGGKTGADGAYSFVDVPAKTQANGGTAYRVRATIVVDNATLVREADITLFQGTDVTQTINFVLATLTGKVVQGNNVPVANANVVLENSDGTTFVPSRTAKTNASGTYTIANVPVGGYTQDPTTKVFTFTSASGNKTYRVFASLNNLSGDSGNFSVNATATTVTVPTIQLTNQQLTGTVFVKYVTANGNYTVPFQGATVELLDSNLNSLSPPRTSTTASDGSYAFANVSGGSYRIRATGKGDTVVSGVFTATSGASQGPDVTLVLHVIFGGVVNLSNQAVPGATVTLSQNGTTIETQTSRADGSFQFAAVAAGSGYLVTAVKGTSSGSKAVPTITRGNAPTPVVVPIKFTPAVTTKPTSFPKGTYAFSMPYETSANATTRNSYDRTRGDATIALSDVFNYAPTGVNAAGKNVRFYTVSRFNPNTLAYEAIADDGVLSRGEGYLLQVTDVPANSLTLRLQMPSDNASLKALSVGSNTNITRFLVNLAYNASLSGNGLNGRNFIGFPFDPSKYSSVTWDATSDIPVASSSVQVIYGGTSYTIKDAVTAGIIYPSLIDGTTGGTTNSLSAYGGYFVTARKSGVQLLLQFPTPNS